MEEWRYKGTEDDVRVEMHYRHEVTTRGGQPRRRTPGSHSTCTSRLPLPDPAPHAPSGLEPGLTAPAARRRTRAGLRLAEAGPAPF